MPRIRTVKPELATHEGMYDLERETGLPMRFAWVMLFTACDRDGRFPWRPRTLKAQILPHDEVEFSRVLDAWGTRGFVVKYRVKNDWFGCIPTWHKHQVINNRESRSDIPSLDEADEVFAFRVNNIDASSTRGARDNDASATRQPRDEDACRKEGKGRKGREGEGNVCKSGESYPQISDSALMDAFAVVRNAYPQFVGDQSKWLLAERAWRQRLDDGIAADDLLAGVERYARYVNDGGVSGPGYVLHPDKFFDVHAKRWAQSWDPPLSKADALTQSNAAAADEARERLFGSES